MTTSAKTHQSKAIGWYAVQRVHITDWLKPRRGQRNENIGSQPFADQLQAFPEGMSKKHHDEPDTTPTPNNERKKNAATTDVSEPKSDGKDAKKLKAVVRESHTILTQAHSVFPFQLFPDSINVDRHKLTILRRQFFGIEQKVSVPLENIKNIEADLGPFFGSITITSDLFINNMQSVHFLWRDDAKKVQKLVQGAVVAQTENIDLNKIDVKELRPLLTDLGSGHRKSM